MHAQHQQPRRLNAIHSTELCLLLCWVMWRTHGPVRNLLNRRLLPHRRLPSIIGSLDGCETYDAKTGSEASAAAQQQESFAGVFMPHVCAGWRVAHPQARTKISDSPELCQSRKERQSNIENRRVDERRPRDGQRRAAEGASERARTRTEVFGGIKGPEGREMKCVKNDVVVGREGSSKSRRGKRDGEAAMNPREAERKGTGESWEVSHAHTRAHTNTVKAPCRVSTRPRDSDAFNSILMNKNIQQ